MIANSWNDIAKNKDIHNLVISRLENDKTLLGDSFTAIKEELSNDFTVEQIVTFFCCFCDYFGGAQIYFPSGSMLKQAITHSLIYKEFNGSNVRELTRKYKVTENNIYRIIEKHRNAEREARNQVAQFKSL
jgi:Mor family transcriptional regulator